MGSPLGPSMTNACLAFPENNGYIHVPLNVNLLFSNIMLMIYLYFFKIALNLFETYLHSRHPNITFTSKSENGGSLYFCGIMLTRMFNTSVYTVASNRDTHFHSFIHHEHCKHQVQLTGLLIVLILFNLDSIS